MLRYGSTNGAAVTSAATRSQTRRKEDGLTAMDTRECRLQSERPIDKSQWSVPEQRGLRSQRSVCRHVAALTRSGVYLRDERLSVIGPAYTPMGMRFHQCPVCRC